MCRERNIDDNQVDNTATEQVTQLLVQLHGELSELLETTAHLREESIRLEHEARKLIDENMQVQIEARLLKEKCSYRRRRRQTLPAGKKRLDFRRLKRQLRRQRRSFLRFERRLRAKYEQPLYEIISKSAINREPPRGRRVRSIRSESID